MIAGSLLQKVYTYIYPAAACSIFQKCTPIYAPSCLAANCVHLYQPRLLPATTFNYAHLYIPRRRPYFCRQPSLFERLCPDFVASIGAHFFCLFFFVFFRRFVCCYMYTFYERRYLLFLPASVKVYTFYISFCIQTPPQGYYMYTYFERLLAAAFQVKVYIF